ncbi:hypothetical protein J132_05635 [Termitomyces sp. J132]|nr:hypothetical protein J132_05635 [Termitomyces sp. J132]
MRFFSLKSFTKASRGSSMPSTGSGMEAFSGIVMLLATAAYHALSSTPSLPAAQSTTIIAQRVIIPPTPTAPINLSPTKCTPTTTDSLNSSTYDTSKVAGVVGIAITLVGAVTLLRHVTSTQETPSETLPFRNGSGSSEDEDSNHTDEESSYEPDEDPSESQDEDDVSDDQDDSSDGNDSDSDPDYEPSDTETESESESEPAEDDDDSVEGRGSADPEDPPPPHSTTDFEFDDIPTPPKDLYDTFTLSLMFSAACLEAIKNYIHRRRALRRNLERNAEKYIKAMDISMSSENDNLGTLANTTTGYQSLQTAVGAAISTSVALCVRPRFDLIPWAPLQTPWLAKNITTSTLDLIHVDLEETIPSTPANATTVVSTDETIVGANNKTVVPSEDTTVTPADELIVIPAQKADSPREPTPIERYWATIIVFFILAVSALLTTKWDTLERQEEPDTKVFVKTMERVEEGEAEAEEIGQQEEEEDIQEIEKVEDAEIEIQDITDEGEEDREVIESTFPDDDDVIGINGIAVGIDATAEEEPAKTEETTRANHSEEKEIVNAIGEPPVFETLSTVDSEFFKVNVGSPEPEPAAELLEEKVRSPEEEGWQVVTRRSRWRRRESIPETETLSEEEEEQEEDLGALADSDSPELWEAFRQRGSNSDLAYIVNPSSPSPYRTARAQQKIKEGPGFGSLEMVKEFRIKIREQHAGDAEQPDDSKEETVRDLSIL